MYDRTGRVSARSVVFRARGKPTLNPALTVTLARVGHRERVRVKAVTIAVSARPTLTPYITIILFDPDPYPANNRNN